MTIRITTVTDSDQAGRQLRENKVDVALIYYPDGLKGCYVCVKQDNKDRIANILGIGDVWEPNADYFCVWVDQTAAQVTDIIRSETRET